jgi:serine/threonine protein kinase
MKYMHACGICHRDLKPGNILMDDRFEIRVADLGSARCTDLKQSLTLGIGTPVYMAPEIAGSEREADYNEKVDVFSFAIVMWELVAWKKAYEGGVLGSALGFLLRVMRGSRPEMSASIKRTPLAEELIVRSWENQPEKRPSFAEIVEMLRDGAYAVVDGVNVEEVSEYVARIEEFERRYPPERAYGARLESGA